MFPVISKLSAAIAGIFRLGITPIKPGPISVAAAIPGQMGAMPDYSLLGVAVAALSNNGAPAFGNFSQTLIPNSQTAATYNANSMVGGIIRRFGASGALTTDSTDTATNIVNAIPGAVPLQTFPLLVANMGSNSVALAAGAGVTMAGTNIIAGFSMRLFLGQVLGSAAVTFTGLFSMPLSSSL